MEAIQRLPNLRGPQDGALLGLPRGSNQYVFHADEFRRQQAAVLACSQVRLGHAFIILGKRSIQKAGPCAWAQTVLHACSGWLWRSDAQILDLLLKIFHLTVPMGMLSTLAISS